MSENSKKRICCFIGHRKIEKTKWLKNKIRVTIENMIVNENVSVFLLGSKSGFNDLCRDILCCLKESYPHITRVYVRAEFSEISDEYRQYLLRWYDDTYYPEKLSEAGKGIYIERNKEMIEKSDYCIIYYNEKYTPPKRKNSLFPLNEYQPNSGTKIAYEYAKKKCSKVINVFETAMY